MAEHSLPWPGTTVGDAGPYSDEDWHYTWGMLFGSQTVPYNNRGVIRNWLNELEVTDGGANFADVDTGAALVYGKFYRNTAVVNVAVPSSVGAWREDLICLQSSWAAQTIRIARHANPADGVAYPAPTQASGATWEIPLAAVRINAAGAITLITDLRDYVSDLMQPKEVVVFPHPDLPINASWAHPSNQSCIGRSTVGILSYLEFKLPEDFSQFVEAYVVLSSGVGLTIDWTLYATGGGCGEALNRWTDSVTADGQVLPTIFLCLDVSGAFDSGTLLAGDFVGAYFDIDVISAANPCYLFELVFRYR